MQLRGRLQALIFMDEWLIPCSAAYLVRQWNRKEKWGYRIRKHWVAAGILRASWSRCLIWMKYRLRWLKDGWDRRKCCLEANGSDLCGSWQHKETQPGLGNVYMLLERYCWKGWATERVADTHKRTVSATVYMEEGKGALTMGLGNYCLNDGQVGNPVRQNQLHTYTDYWRWEEDSCNKATTERQMLQYHFFENTW